MQAFPRIVLIGALALVNAFAFCQQDDEPSHPRGRPISATFKDADVREALLTFFRTINVSFAMDPRIHGRVTADYKNTNMLDIADDVARRVNAVMVQKNGICHIVSDEKNPPNAEDPRSLGSYVFYFSNRPLRHALQAIYDTGGLEQATSLHVNVDSQVSLSGRFDSFVDAMKAVVDHANATMIVTKSNFSVYRNAFLEPVHWAATDVTVRADKTDVRDVIRGLFRNVNANYSISPTVQGKVTGFYSGPLFDALNELLRPVGATSRLVSGVVQIDSIEPMTRQERPSVVSLPTEFKKMQTADGLTFSNTKVEEIVKRFFARLPGRYHLPAIDTMLSIELSQQDLEKALLTLCDKAGLAVSVQDGVFVFSQRPKITIGGGRGLWIFSVPPPPFRLDP